MGEVAGADPGGREHGQILPPPIVYTTYSFIQHTKLCSIVQNLVKTEYYTAPESRQSGQIEDAWFIKFVGVAQNFECASYQILDPPQLGSSHTLS